MPSRGQPSIDQDHYGAAFAYRLATRTIPAWRSMALQARTGRDASVHFAFGDAAIVERIASYIENDACKFILPRQRGDEDMRRAGGWWRRRCRGGGAVTRR
jgi:hypothetical protein